jgi:hypothetical protein
LPFSDKKIIPRNTKQDGADGSSVGIPPVSRKRKISEFRSELFLGRKKPLEFRSKPFLNDKTLEFLSKPFSEKKTSEFCSEPFCGRKKNLEFHSEHFSEEKTLENLFQTIFRTENTRKTTTFVSCFVKPYYFRGIPFRFVWFRISKLALLMNTEFRGMSTFFRGITKTVPSLFRGISSERNFDGNPIRNGEKNRKFSILKFFMTQL